MSPELLAAGQRWAADYRRRHPRARTEREIQAAFDTAEAADEQERDSRR